MMNATGTAIDAVHNTTAVGVAATELHAYPPHHRAVRTVCASGSSTPSKTAAVTTIHTSYAVFMMITPMSAIMICAIIVWLLNEGHKPSPLPFDMKVLQLGMVCALLAFELWMSAAPYSLPAYVCFTAALATTMLTLFVYPVYKMCMEEEELEEVD